MENHHEKREENYLFPALKTVVSAHEYGALGEQYENEERRLLGQEGFETIIAEIAELEKQLGINDLNQFIPSVQDDIRLDRLKCYVTGHWIGGCERRIFKLRVIIFPLLHFLLGNDLKKDQSRTRR